MSKGSNWHRLVGLITQDFVVRDGVGPEPCPIKSDSISGIKSIHGIYLSGEETIMNTT